MRKFLRATGLAMATWRSCRNDFFLPVRALSKLFRGKFLDHLKSLREKNRLVYPGAIGHLAEAPAFNSLITELYGKEWVVYAKPPSDGTKGVLEYLGRYTHRIAISNHRIVQMENASVSFRWRDYADGNRTKIMTVGAAEFIRRFLLHVLPDRFVQIRHYGLLGNRCRKEKLEICRRLLACSHNEPEKRNRDLARRFAQAYRRRCDAMSRVQRRQNADAGGDSGRRGARPRPGNRALRWAG